jgi:predicted nucleic acid-binding protein
MKIDRGTILFFDTSCLITAAGSPSEGSGFLLSLCARKMLQGAVSQPVWLEAQQNILGRLGCDPLNTFFKLMSSTPLILASLPDALELLRIGRLVNARDTHVIAAAQAVKAHFLLTLDHRLIEQVNNANLGFKALTSQDFIKFILPTHIDYSERAVS